MRQTDNFSILLSKDVKYVFVCFTDLQMVVAVFPYLKMMLVEYVKKTQQIQIDLPHPDCTDAVPITEQIVKKYEGCTPVGRFNLDDHMDDVFRLSVERFNEGERKWMMFEIDVPLAPLLSASKCSESSIVPVLETMIGNAIRRNYNVGDKTIIGYTPVDMRSVFRVKTGSNDSTTVAIPYRPVMDKYDLSKRYMFMRSILDIQIQPENINIGLLDLTEKYRKVDSQPYPIESIVPVVKKKSVRVGGMTPYTYGLLYPGKISFPNQVEPFVDSIAISVSGCSFPLMIEACE